jgi:hypothetical protein
MRWYLDRGCTVIAVGVESDHIIPVVVCLGNVAKVLGEKRNRVRTTSLYAGIVARKFSSNMKVKDTLLRLEFVCC